jgi:hypothetical protein
MSNGASAIPQIQRNDRRRTKFPRALSLWLALFSTMSCIVGGMALVVSRRGNELLPPVGALMALVMTSVTWLGVRRQTPRTGVA